MWKPLHHFFKRSSKEAVSGITIFILQKKLQRFTNEELSHAMQRAWGRTYDATRFYGMSTFDGEGGLLKMNDMFFTMQHFDRKVDGSVLNGRELPLWAEHAAYTSFGYSCRGGIPPGKVRDQLGWLIGRLCAELLGQNTAALLFKEANILVPFTPAFDQKLRAEPGHNPERLFAQIEPQ